MIEFSFPWAFVLMPLPILVWRFLAPLPQKSAVRAPDSVIAFLRRHSDPGAARRTGIRNLLPKALGWLCLIVALAGPFSRRPALLTPTGRDIVVAIDLSASMAEEDMVVDGTKSARIEVIRERMASFLKSRTGDRVALIGFAEEAFLIAPLTFDVRAVADMVSEAPIGLPGRKTDLGRAIGLSVKLLRGEQEKEDGERLMILISDGEANAGDLAAMDAANLAKDIGLKIFAIGFATGMDAASMAHMTDLAEVTGGRFVSAIGAGAMDDAYRAVSGMAPVAQPDAMTERRRDLRWPALCGVLVCLGLLTWREARET